MLARTPILASPCSRCCGMTPLSNHLIRQNRHERDLRSLDKNSTRRSPIRKFLSSNALARRDYAARVYAANVRCITGTVCGCAAEGPNRDTIAVRKLDLCTGESPRPLTALHFSMPRCANALIANYMDRPIDIREPLRAPIRRPADSAHWRITVHPSPRRPDRP